MIPFVGPSYALEDRQASVARSVNLYLRKLETPGKAGVIMSAWPGMTQVLTLGAEVRGAMMAKRRAFVVAGSALYEVVGDIATSRGVLSSSTGRVGMAVLADQLVITDGSGGYVLTLSSNSFEQITDPDFPGSAQVSTVDAWALFNEPNSQRFMVSALNDAADIDALDIASAESFPDDIVAHEVSGREVYLLGEQSTEVWYVTGDDFPLGRRTVIDVGCTAPWSVGKADNALMFIAQDKNGAGMVGLIAGYQYKRVSSFALEAELAKSTDLAASYAFVLQWAGETFYVLQVPGMETTPVYQVSVGAWCDLADLDEDGNFQPFRATHHLFDGSRHLLFDATGAVYEMDAAVNTFAGDRRACERTSPSDAAMLLERQRYNRFVLDCTTGEAAEGVSPYVQLSWSNDGGMTWSDPVLRSAGLTGEYRVLPTWRRLGIARDRVWKVRFTDDAPFAIISGTWA